MLRCTLFNCRLKTRVIIIGFSVLLVCCLLLYRALTTLHAKHHHGHHPLPTLEQKSQRLQFQPKDFDIPRANKLSDSFETNILHNNKVKNHLKYASLIPKEFQIVKDRELLNADYREAMLKFLSTLYPKNWATALETDEKALDLKYLLIDYGLESNMSCKQIDSLIVDDSVSHSDTALLQFAYATDSENTRSRDFMASQFSRRSQFDKLAYVVKSLSSDRETQVACMKQINALRKCAAMGNYKMLREVLLLTVLRHPNIAALKGYCLRGSRVSIRLPEKGVVLVTEIGTPLTSSAVSNMAWSRRVSIALQIGQLLQYLNTSPMGSLRLKTLNLQDFMLVQGKYLKLVDLTQLELGDLPCSDVTECGTSEIVSGESCKNGFCEGMNGVISFHHVARGVLQQVLQNPPGSEEEAFISKLRNHQLGLTQFVEDLWVFSNKSYVELPKDIEGPSSARIARPEATVEAHTEHRADGERWRDFRKTVQTASWDGSLYNFIRYDHKNFAGIYDYVCDGSRVSWGCVHIVTSLQEAATRCLRDAICRAFVTFSVQPESDNLLTVVLKNDTDSNPHVSSGTTLFVHRYAVPRQKEGEGGGGNTDEQRARDTERRGEREEQRGRDVESKKHEKRRASGVRQPGEIQSCINDTLQHQEAVVFAREKRLMAHLDLKGIREETWRRSASGDRMEEPTQIMTADGGSGGRFVASLMKESLEKTDVESRKVVFIAENGPRVHHLAYALLYHLDRLLGLYHTPPCVGKQLSASNVELYLRNGLWKEVFKSQIKSDGTLSGIVTVPMPQAMKNMRITLEPLGRMPVKIVSFKRSQKLQLEYILLWWLGKIDYNSTDHQGYKDQLIHFHADKAFGYNNLDMSSYFYNCQFPNTVYKSLKCFQCSLKQETEGARDSVCSLGQEVVRRAQAMVNGNFDFRIHNLSEDQVVSTINSAASSAFHIIQNCIQTFGHDNVLY